MKPPNVRALPLYLSKAPSMRPQRIFGAPRPSLRALVFRDKRRAAVGLGIVIKTALVLAVVYRHYEFHLTALVASPPQSFCERWGHSAAAAAAAAAGAAAVPAPAPAPPLVCAHGRDREHPSPDSPDALREALAAGTGCVLLHVASTSDGALVALRNTPEALRSLLSAPARGSALAARLRARRAAAGPAGVGVGDVSLAELRELRWRRPTRRRRRARGGPEAGGKGRGGDDDSTVLTLEEALRLLLPPPQGKEGEAAAAAGAGSRAPPAPPARPLATLILDLERPLGAARRELPLPEMARKAVAAAAAAGCGGGARCLVWAMQDDLVVAAAEAAGRLKKRGRAPSLRLGYFVAERRDRRHPRLKGVASAAAVHVEMLASGRGPGKEDGAAVVRALHGAEAGGAKWRLGGGGGGGGAGGGGGGQQVFAYLINRPVALRQAVVAGADALITDRGTEVMRVLEAWQGQCEARRAAAAGAERRRR